MNTHGYNEGSYGRWISVDVAPTALIDGGDPSSTTHILKAHGRSATNIGNTFQLAYAQMQNRSGSTVNLGLGVRLPISLWKAGQWTHATTTFVDDTTDFQDAGTADAALETTTVNDGFLVSSPIPFNALAIAVTTASAGSPVRVIEYSNGASTWTGITNFINFAGSSANYTGSGAENVIVWVPPANWGKMTASHGTNVDTNHYGLRIRATTAPSTAGVAATMSVHRLYFLLEGLADGNVYEVPLGGMYFPFDVEGEALVSYISVLNNQNRVTALVRSRG